MSLTETRLKVCPNYGKQCFCTGVCKEPIAETDDEKFIRRWQIQDQFDRKEKARIRKNK